MIKKSIGGFPSIWFRIIATGALAAASVWLLLYLPGARLWGLTDSLEPEVEGFAKESVGLSGARTGEDSSESMVAPSLAKGRRGVIDYTTVEEGIEPDGSLTGVVVDHTGNPQAGALVSWHQRGLHNISGIPLGAIKTGTRGEFQLARKVNAQDGVVLVSHVPWAVASRWVSAAETSVEIVLGPDIAVSGTVVWSDTAENLSSGRVVVRGPGGEFLGASNVDAGGSFQVRLRPRGDAGFFYSEENGYARASAWLHLRRGQEEDRVVLEVQRRRQLRGRVRSSALDAPVGNARIFAGTNSRERCTTRGDGTFVVEDWIPQGELLVLARAQGYRAKASCLVLDDTERAAEEVVIELEVGSAIIGRLLGESGKPVEGASVTIEECWEACGTELCTNVREMPDTRSGAFYSDSVWGNGAITLTFRAPGRGSFVRVIAADPGPGSLVDLGVLQFTGAWTVRGVVKNEGNCTPVGWTVTATPLLEVMGGVVRGMGGAVRRSVERAAVASSGDFILPKLGPGKWNIALRDQRGSVLRKQVVDLALGSGETLLEFDVALSSATIRVVSSGGSPVAGLLIELQRTSGPNARSTLQQTDHRGELVLLHLEEGQCYTALVRDRRLEGPDPTLKVQLELCFPRDDGKVILVEHGSRVTYSIVRPLEGESGVVLLEFTDMSSGQVTRSPSRPDGSGAVVLAANRTYEVSKNRFIPAELGALDLPEEVLMRVGSMEREVIDQIDVGPGNANHFTWTLVD